MILALALVGAVLCSPLSASPRRDTRDTPYETRDTSRRDTPFPLPPALAIGYSGGVVLPQTKFTVNQTTSKIDAEQTERLVEIYPNDDQGSRKIDESHAKSLVKKSQPITTSERSDTTKDILNDDERIIDKYVEVSHAVSRVEYEVSQYAKGASTLPLPTAPNKATEPVVVSPVFVPRISVDGKPLPLPSKTYKRMDNMEVLIATEVPSGMDGRGFKIDSSYSSALLGQTLEKYKDELSSHEEVTESDHFSTTEYFQSGGNHIQSDHNNNLEISSTQHPLESETSYDTYNELTTQNVLLSYKSNINASAPSNTTHDLTKKPGLKDSNILVNNSSHVVIVDEVGEHGNHNNKTFKREIVKKNLPFLEPTIRKVIYDHHSKEHPLVLASKEYPLVLASRTSKHSRRHPRIYMDSKDEDRAEEEEAIKSSKHEPDSLISFPNLEDDLTSLQKDDISKTEVPTSKEYTQSLVEYIEVSDTTNIKVPDKKLSSIVSYETIKEIQQNNNASIERNPEKHEVLAESIGSSSVLTFSSASGKLIDSRYLIYVCVYIHVYKLYSFIFVCILAFNNEIK